MKNLKICALVICLFNFQATFANTMIPAGLVGQWLEEGGKTEHVPELIIFKGDDSFEYRGRLGHDSGHNCLVTITGPITSVEYLGSSSYKIDGIGRATLGKSTPLPGTTSRECLDLEYDEQYGMPFHFLINNLNLITYNSPRSDGSVGEFKKIYKVFDS